MGLSLAEQLAQKKLKKTAGPPAPKPAGDGGDGGGAPKAAPGGPPPPPPPAPPAAPKAATPPPPPAPPAPPAAAAPPPPAPPAPKPATPPPPPAPAPKSPPAASAAAASKATATVDFQGRDADELTFKAGDVILIHSETADKGWFNAEFRGRKGLAPNTHFRMGTVVSSPPAPPAPTIPKASPPPPPAVKSSNMDEKATATADFQGRDADELSFKAGDIIHVHSETADKGWFNASFNGRKGLAPNTHFKKNAPNPPSSMSPAPAAPKPAPAASPPPPAPQAKPGGAYLDPIGAIKAPTDSVFNRTPPPAAKGPGSGGPASPQEKEALRRYMQSIKASSPPPGVTPGIEAQNHQRPASHPPGWGQNEWKRSQEAEWKASEHERLARMQSRQGLPLERERKVPTVPTGQGFARQTPVPTQDHNSLENLPPADDLVDDLLNLMTFGMHKTEIHGPRRKSGVGLVLSPAPAPCDWQVSNIVPGGPASLSGNVQIGDALVTVNGVPCNGISINGVAQMLSGPPKSSVVIQLASTVQGQPPLRSVTLVRNHFEDSVNPPGPQDVRQKYTQMKRTDNYVNHGLPEWSNPLTGIWDGITQQFENSLSTPDANNATIKVTQPLPRETPVTGFLELSVSEAMDMPSFDALGISSFSFRVTGMGQSAVLPVKSGTGHVKYGDTATFVLNIFDQSVIAGQSEDIRVVLQTVNLLGGEHQCGVVSFNGPELIAGLRKDGNGLGEGWYHLMKMEEGKEPLVIAGPTIGSEAQMFLKFRFMAVMMNSN